MSWVLQKEELTTFAKSFDKSVKLTTKDYWLFKVIAWLLFFWSKSKRKRFTERFATTVGHIQGYPKAWPASHVKDVIPHECRHTKQMRWFGFMIHPIVGVPLGLVIYGFLFFPLYFALFRLLLEIDADKRKWEYWVSERGVTNKKVFLTHARLRAERVTSSDYLWSWNRKHAVKLYTKAAEKFHATFVG